MCIQSYVLINLCIPALGKEYGYRNAYITYKIIYMITFGRSCQIFFKSKDTYNEYIWVLLPNSHVPGKVVAHIYLSTEDMRHVASLWLWSWGTYRSIFIIQKTFCYDASSQVVCSYWFVKGFKKLMSLLLYY